MTTSEWSHDAQVALDLQRLHELRQAIQADFTEAADRQPFPDAEWLILRTAVTEAIENARLVTAHNQTRLEWPGEDLADIGHAVAVSAHELLTGPELPRVKHCAGCHWLFLTNQKWQPPLVQHGRLRHPRQNAALRRPPRRPTATQHAMITPPAAETA